MNDYNGFRATVLLVSSFFFFIPGKLNPQISTQQLYQYRDLSASFLLTWRRGFVELSTPTAFQYQIPWQWQSFRKLRREIPGRLVKQTLLGVKPERSLPWTELSLPWTVELSLPWLTYTLPKTPSIGMTGKESIHAQQNKKIKPVRNK